MSSYTNNPHATNTQLSWIEDMIAHVQPHHMSEFSVSGSGEDTSVFWELGLTVPDPFATHSPSDTILLEGLPLDTISGWKETGRMKAEADHHVGGEVVILRAQASPAATSTPQSQKRKLEQVDSHGDSNKEHVVSESLSCPAPAATWKRICREKTGTEWEMVLDVVKFGEELRSKQNHLEAVIQEITQVYYDMAVLNAATRRL
ncbi:hypothetical protein BDR07DRAFT_1476323 [Suillus spraguei]|nr:hypothetical protein BDR07DRAFT_1476323 [Suillus spraguei]